MKPVKLHANAASKRRREVREALFASAPPSWRGPADVGFFCAPRSILFVLQALRLKTVSGGKDPGAVYLELMSRHIDEGVVEMTYEENHAAACDYTVRAWRERMAALEKLGFITVHKQAGRYAKVLIVHPSIAMQALHDAGKIDSATWEGYRDRQIDSKEPTSAQLLTGKIGVA